MTLTIVIGVLIAVAAIIAGLLLKINVSAALARRKAIRINGERVNVRCERQLRYAEELAELIRCETVADGEHEEHFARFRQLLKTRFPLLHERGELQMFGGGCLIFKVSGKNADRNVMLMSHHDVVKAEGDWEHAPFSGEVAGGALWGRGTVDTKTPLFAELTAVEELLAEGFHFEGINVYIGSSHNEEICGNGIPLAVEHFKEQGIRFHAVLDEGGAITTGMMPGVSRKSAMVAVHEKGRHTFTCTAQSADKGHLGLNPVTGNVINRMSAFICKVNKTKLFRSSFSPEVEATFVTHAPYMRYPYRLLFANFGLFRGLLIKLLPKVSAQVGGMLGTTMHFTTIEAGKSEQTQAKTAVATAFFRCVREETLQRELARFEKIAAKYDITVTPKLVSYCRPFSQKQPQYQALQEVLHQNFPDVVVSPFLLTAGTDARHFSDIADCILRFAPIDLSKQQYASVHNANENISVSNIGECVCFYKSYLKKLAD